MCTRAPCATLGDHAPLGERTPVCTRAPCAAQGTHASVQGSRTVAAATDLNASNLHPLAKHVVHQDTITRPSEKVHKLDGLLRSALHLSTSAPFAIPMHLSTSAPFADRRKLIVAEEYDPNALAAEAHNLHKASSQAVIRSLETALAIRVAGSAHEVLECLLRFLGRPKQQCLHPARHTFHK